MNKNMLIRTLAFVFLVATLAVLVSQSALFAGSFTVSETRSFTIAHDNAPWIYYVESVSSGPSEGTNKTLYVSFNVTDEDGVINLNDSSARVTLTLSDVSRTSTECSTDDMNNSVRQYNCTLSMPYYDIGGTWSVNASIADNNSNSDENISQTLSWSDLTAITISLSEMDFGTQIAGSTDVASSDNPLIVNNTGNVNITSINITSYTLMGVTDGNYTIGVGNFSFNVTDSAEGQIMNNATSLSIPLANVTVHNDSIQITEDLYLYMDIPSGLLSQEYRSITEWILEAFTS